MSYRNDAQKNLERFEVEFQSGDNERLKYAALELRMAMEALTYDRAFAYKDEFPPTEYETWQPRKVMSVLLEIEPTADQNCSVAFGLQETYGVPAPVMQSLGAERVLSMAILRKHYDALGSYLHTQSMKKIRDGNLINFDKMRKRCQEIAVFIRDILSSPIFNVTVGNFSKWDCDECGKTIRKRLPFGQKEVDAECYHCVASYKLVDKGNGKIECHPNRHKVKCASDRCKKSLFFWQRDFDIGKTWECTECKGLNTFVLGVLHETKAR